MKWSRVRAAFPWRIAALSVLVPCLPLLTLVAWFHWELQPLQRYYLIDYWGSTEGAKQPGSLTAIQWIYASAPGRNRQVAIEGDVTAGGKGGFSVQLSSFALKQGWTRVEKGLVQSYPSDELEELLREDFYAGRRLPQLVTEPLLNGCVAWLVLVLPMFSMRNELLEEWSRLHCPAEEPD